MAKAIYLEQIRKRMDSIHKEYNALSEAYRILTSAGSVRGRKAKIPTLDEMLGAEVKVKTGKRGRPPGAKNKPGANKPGPKPSAAKMAEVKMEKMNKPEAKPAVVNAPAVKVTKIKAKVSAKPAKAVKPKRTAKPAKSVQIAKADVSVKRNRIPNLAEKIQELVAKGGRFTTNSVITDKLTGLYPGKSRSDLGKYISVILANMKARKELSVLTQDSKGNKMRSGLWGLPTWFEGAKPKAEYLK
jgi:hypothetical protein